MYLFFMPNIVPHIFKKVYIFVFLRSRWFAEKIERDFRVNYLISPTVDDHERAVIWLECLSATLHHLKKRIYCLKFKSTLVVQLVFLADLYHQRIASVIFWIATEYFCLSWNEHVKKAKNVVNCSESRAKFYATCKGWSDYDGAFKELTVFESQMICSRAS